MIRLNPLSMNEELLVGLLAAAVIGGGGLYLYKRSNPTITVAPGTQTVSAKAGSTVTLKLPAGAMWQAVAAGGANGVSLSPASGTGGYSLPNVSAGEIINATWKDSSGATQNSTITVASA